MKVYQVFNLNLEEIGKLKKEELLRLNLPKAGEKLIQQLQEKGYEVFVDFDNYGGLPTSIIVATEMPSDQSVKSDFYGAVDGLGINYFSSGRAYTQTFLLEISPASPQVEFREVEQKWIRDNKEFLKRFEGEWIVVEGEKLIAHGTDIADVAREARGKGVEIPYIVKISYKPKLHL